MEFDLGGSRNRAIRIFGAAVGRSLDHVKGLIGSGRELRVRKLQRKGPAISLARKIRIDQIQRARRIAFIGIFLELPTAHHGAAIRDLDAI